MIELPPLPYGASPAYGYTEAEMLAYGEACARAAMEAAAEKAEFILKSLADDHDNPVERAAYAIRALTAPSSPSSSRTRS
jgi:hypothetical protein